MARALTTQLYLYQREIQAGGSGQPRTLWLGGTARKQRETRRRGRWNIRVPRVMMEIFHLWDERLILSSEEVPASEDVFPSTAKLCCVNFSLFTLLWNDGIPVTFCLSCTCWHCYSFLWYLRVNVNKNHRLSKKSRTRSKIDLVHFLPVGSLI